MELSFDPFFMINFKKNCETRQDRPSIECLKQSWDESIVFYGTHIDCACMSLLLTSYIMSAPCTLVFAINFRIIILSTFGFILLKLLVVL
jgi:hypothetical protein